MPHEGALIRANIPIFGSIKVRDGVKLKGWWLEYGAGASPETWIVLKEGTEPIPEDPNEAGKIRWNPNKEPTGNLTNWATGLGKLGVRL